MASSEPDTFAHLIERYSSLLAAHEGLGVAMSWAAARTDANASSIMDLISPDWVRQGVGGLAHLEERSYDDDSGREHVGWLIGTGEQVGLFEVNGFGGSQEAGLRAWARGVPVLAGIFWDVNLANQLAIARDGQFVSAELWAEGHIAGKGAAIARYESSFTPETDLRAFGLAVVESETGLRLDDDLLRRQWPIVRFAAREGVGRRPSRTARVSDEVLYAALVAAPESRFIEAKVLSADYAARSTGLDGEPVVQEVIQAIRAGQEPAHNSEVAQNLHLLRARLDQEAQASPFEPGDLDDPARRRLQAYTVLNWMPRVQRYYDDAEDDFDVAEHIQGVWQHVVWAVGESWPTLRNQLIELVG